MAQQRRTPSGQHPGRPTRGARGPVRDAGARPGAVRGTSTRGASARGASPARSATARSGGLPPRADERPAVVREVSGRSASHPATLRRPATPGAARRTAPPQSGRLTGRAAALGLVVLALMLAYAYPVRLYLDQQAQIQQLELAQAAQRLRIGALKAETDKWNDPAYVAAQVGARFQMVKPGQKTVYIVLPAPPDAAKSGKNPSNNDSTWYGAMWNAIAGAGGGS